MTHWMTRYDPDDGEPYGELCDCAIDEDHDAAEDDDETGDEGDDDRPL